MGKTINKQEGRAGQSAKSLVSEGKHSQQERKINTVAKRKKYFVFHSQLRCVNCMDRLDPSFLKTHILSLLCSSDCSFSWALGTRNWRNRATLQTIGPISSHKNVPAILNSITNTPQFWKLNCMRKRNCATRVSRFCESHSKHKEDT